MLGSQAIIHRHNQTAACFCKRVANPVMGIKIADYPAAAPEINEYRKRRIARRVVESYRNFAARAGYAVIFYSFDCQRRIRWRR